MGREGEDIQVLGYSKSGKEDFAKKTVRDLYIEKAMHCAKVDDDDKEKLHKYFYQTRVTPGVDVEHSTPRGTYQPQEERQQYTTTRSVFAGKKYKPVAKKVKPVYQDLPDQFRIIRDIKGDPLADMPPLNTHPRDFVPTGRYTQERKDKMDEMHAGDFLWPEERKLVHEVIMNQNEAFAWDDSERGKFKEEYFPPISIPVVEHTPWVERNIPIPPGMREQVIEFIRKKMDAGTYEPSNSSYRSKWFTVMKKDGKSFRIVHSLEPLNAVTIAHSGLPPAADELAEHFAGRACGGILDLYVGYDERLLAERSRDMTTFQTPFGALRLVTLPMGWTNSVPIFHDDVTYILREEVPVYTKPYIDDVPIRGPATRYELPGGGYETIPENPGIRRFVWEHMQAVNRIIQRMRYAGGTFSGYKSLLCAEEITVVGHLCTYEGRKPSVDKLWTIANWGPCKNIGDVRSFLGTVGLLRIYIQDYARKAEGLQKLLRGKIPFEWGEEQEESMKNLKEAAAKSHCIKPLDYSKPGNFVLAVDTSYQAVGYYIYYEDPENTKKKDYARFGSIALEPREQRFSQPKRELYGLLRALKACYYWLIGCRKLVIETDAKYIKGMLENPGMGPNATINRWIDQILLFHFELRHVAGRTFGADGLSRREYQDGDEIVENPEEGVAVGEALESYVKKFEQDEDPEEFESFKHKIDTRGGYVQALSEEDPSYHLPTSYRDFDYELEQASQQYMIEETMVQEHLREGKLPEAQAQFLINTRINTEPLVFAMDDISEEDVIYDESQRRLEAIALDKKLPGIMEWLQDTNKRPEGMSDKAYRKFRNRAEKFFLDGGRLYRKSDDGEHRLVVLDKTKRFSMMRAAHESLGHRGAYSTNDLLARRFWWPEMDKDVNWHVKTCQRCQERQKAMFQIPRVETHTPSIFEHLFMDTLFMTPASNNCKYIVHGRCSLTTYAEARALREENATTVAQWLFEDIVCRWGCLQRITTDNSKVFVKVLKIMEQYYGIKGISISPYNSRANGKVERPHWDLRQMLAKACGKDHLHKWAKFLTFVLWADRISIRKGLGCSPFFLVTGAQPLIPLDIQEATWAITVTDKLLTTEELIGYRARALARHKAHVEEVRNRVSLEKRIELDRFERKCANKIRDFDFKPGDLVMMRHSEIENNLNRKMKRRYLGPMIVIARKKGGAYVLAEMDGHVSQFGVAAYRVIPYFARPNIKLPDNIHDVIDQTAESLKEILLREDDYDDADVQYEDFSDDSDKEFMTNLVDDDLEEAVTGPAVTPTDEQGRKIRRSKRAK